MAQSTLEKVDGLALLFSDASGLLQVCPAVCTLPHLLAFNGQHSDQMNPNDQHSTVIFWLSLAKLVRFCQHDGIEMWALVPHKPRQVSNDASTWFLTKKSRLSGCRMVPQFFAVHPYPKMQCKCVFVYEGPYMRGGGGGSPHVSSCYLCLHRHPGGSAVFVALKGLGTVKKNR